MYQEKTLANTLDQAKRMRAAYIKDRDKHVVQVGHQACSFGHLADVEQFLTPADRIGQSQRACDAELSQYAARQSAVGAAGAAYRGRESAERCLERFADTRAFDANRFIHWRYFWDYSGGNVSENMSQQLAFWYRALQLQIPKSATMSGGIYLWNDGRETPDTMDVSLEQPEQMLVSWSSGFGNNQLGVTEDLAGLARDHLARQSRALHAAENQPARRRRTHGPRRACAARAHGELLRCDPHQPRTELPV